MKKLIVAVIAAFAFTAYAADPKPAKAATAQAPAKAASAPAKKAEKPVAVKKQ